MRKRVSCPFAARALCDQPSEEFPPRDLSGICITHDSPSGPVGTLSPSRSDPLTLPALLPSHCFPLPRPSSRLFHSTHSRQCSTPPVPSSPTPLPSPSPSSVSILDLPPVPTPTDPGHRGPLHPSNRTFRQLGTISSHVSNGPPDPRFSLHHHLSHLISSLPIPSLPSPSPFQPP